MSFLERTSETKIITYEGESILLHRVVATHDAKYLCDGIECGQKGGWVDDDTNIDNYDMWIGDDCIVIDSHIGNYTEITGQCVVYQSTVTNSKIKGNVNIIESELDNVNAMDNAVIFHSTASGVYSENAFLYYANDKYEDIETEEVYGTTVNGNNVLARFSMDEDFDEFLKVYNKYKDKRIEIKKEKKKPKVRHSGMEWLQKSGYIPSNFLQHYTQITSEAIIKHNLNMYTITKSYFI